MNSLRLYLLLLLGISGAFRSASIRYTLDPATSRLTWTGYAETGTWAPSGTIQLRRGSFEYDGRTVSHGRCEIDMRTLAHSNATLQEHLRGDDFFAVQRFPTAVFELASAGAGQATGRLTLRGVTHNIRFPLSVTPRPDGLHLQGVATIDRTQFGVRFNSSSFFQNLGDQAIRNDFQLAFEVVARPASAKSNVPYQPLWLCWRLGLRQATALAVCRFKTRIVVHAAKQVQHQSPRIAHYERRGNQRCYANRGYVHPQRRVAGQVIQQHARNHENRNRKGVADKHSAPVKPGLWLVGLIADGTVRRHFGELTEVSSGVREQRALVATGAAQPEQGQGRGIYSGHRGKAKQVVRKAGAKSATIAAP
jgi:polyisoprenoid-binding protein YceI